MLLAKHFTFADGVGEGSLISNALYILTQVGGSPFLPGVSNANGLGAKPFPYAGGSKGRGKAWQLGGTVSIVSKHTPQLRLNICAY